MRFFAVLAGILVTGCHHESKPTTTPEDVSTGRSETMGGMSEGASCGGIAGLPCKTGLTCKMPAHPTADQSGICTSP